MTAAPSTSSVSNPANLSRYARQHRPTPYTVALALGRTAPVVGIAEMGPPPPDILYETQSIVSLLQHWYRTLNDADPVHRLHLWLMVMTETLDAFLDGIAAATRVRADDDPTSQWGVFLRALHIGLDALSFEQMAHLWCCMKLEIHEQIPPFSWKDPLLSNGAVPSVSSSSHIPPWTLSAEQLDRAVRESIYSSSSHPPPFMNAAAAAIASSVPAASYPRVPTADRAAAVHALHADIAANDNDVWPYASLRHALLHDAFGEANAQRDAIQEALAVTQQQPAEAATAPAALCAMAWLALVGPTSNNSHRLLYQRPHSHQEAMLRRCIQRAFRAPPHLWMGLHWLLAARTHSWVPWQQALSGGATEKGGPTMTMTSNATNTSRYDRPMHVWHRSDPERPSALARHQLVAADIYHYYGEHALSMCSLQQVLRCSSVAASLEPADLLTAIRNASILGCTTGSTQWAYDPAISNAATEPKMPTDGCCIYGNALSAYISLCDAHHISVTHNQLCAMDLLLVVHEWAVQRRAMDQARRIMTILQGLTHDPHIQKYYSQNMDAILYQKVLLLSRSGQYDAAKKLLQQWIAHCRAQERHRPTAMALLHLATLYIEEGEEESCQPQHALGPLLECLSMAKEHKMDGIYNEGLLVLAQIHLYFRQYRRTSFLIQMILPSLHRSSPISIQASAYWTLAQCRLHQAAEAGKNENTRRQIRLWQAAIQALQTSCRLWERCQDVRKLQEAYYWLAHIYHRWSVAEPFKIDGVPLRDAAARQCLQYAAASRTMPVVSVGATKEGILTLVQRWSTLL